MSKCEVSFGKLSKAEKRVAIAKDVLKWIKTGVAKAETGTYFRIPQLDGDEGINSELFGNLELRDIIEKNQLKCTVCAKGAIFLSSLMKRNNFTLNMLSSYGEVRGQECCDRVSDIFTRTQLDLIEDAFEGTYETSDGVDYWNTYDDGYSNKDKAIKKFYEKYTTDEGRLVAIMNNIIKNKGEFVL